MSNPTKVKGLREMGLDQPNYSIKSNKWCNPLFYKDNKQDQSMRQMTKSIALIPWIFTSSGTAKNRKDTMKWPDIIQDYENWLFMFHLSSLLNDIKERKKYWLLQPEIAESEATPLFYVLCGYGRSINNKDASQSTLSACNHNEGSINQHSLVWNFPINK
jgi:hypothetical protein